MKKAIAIILVSVAMGTLSALMGCETQAGKDERDIAERKFQTSLQKSANDAAERLHEAELEGVRLSQGELAADQLKICFMDGGYDYPRRSNLDGSVREIHLSNRVVANCDRIMQIQARIYARQDAEEKRKDDAYDKAHKQ